MSDPTFYAGQTLPADELQKLALFGTWTPTLTVVTLGTNPALGTGATTDGEYQRNGRAITVQFDITLGTGATAGSGTYQIGGLPFDIANLGAGQPLAGCIFALDGATRYSCAPRTQSATAVTMVRNAIESATEITAALATWSSGDSFRGEFTYLADI